MTLKTALAGRTCNYWDCNDSIPQGHNLCEPHYRLYRGGQVDQCLNCGRLKPARHAKCEDCRNGNPPRDNAPSPRHQNGGGTQPRPRGQQPLPQDAGPIVVYAVHLRDGAYYANQTRDLPDTMQKHRNDDIRATAGRHPALVWFSVTQDREHAETLEAQVRNLCHENPKTFRTWLEAFGEALAELG